jgi:hypothetical protein
VRGLHDEMGDLLAASRDATERSRATRERLRAQREAASRA